MAMRLLDNPEHALVDARHLDELAIGQRAEHERGRRVLWFEPAVALPIFDAQGCRRWESRI
jgi:hypothetical protein